MSSPWVLNLPRSSKSQPFIPPKPLRLTNAAIAEAKGKDRCTIQISIASKQANNPTTCIIGSLIPGKIEQFQMNIVLDPKQEYVVSHLGESSISIAGFYEAFPDDQIEFDDADADANTRPLSPIAIPKLERLSPALGALSAPLTRTRSASLLRHDSSASLIGYELLEKPSAKAAGKKRKAATDAPAASTSAKKAKDLNPIEPPLPAPAAYNAVAPISSYVGSPGTPSTPAASTTSLTVGHSVAVARASSSTHTGPSESVDKKAFMLKGVTCWDLLLGAGRAADESGAVGICFVLAVIDPENVNRKTDVRELRPPALFTFDMTDPKVIAGLRYGIVGMKINGERHLTIPPALAFGDDGVAQDLPLYGSPYGSGPIPRGSWLYMKIKLFQVNGGK